MSNERDIPETGRDDRLVSMTYREVADERAPEALNQSILQQAAAAAKPRYARNMSWMRPMAWAATIGLSLAIVLEVTQVQQPEGAYDISADAVSSPAEESRQREDARSAGALEEVVVEANAARKKESAFPVQTESGAPAASVVPVANQPAPELAEESKLDASQKPALAMQKASKPELADTFYRDEDEAEAIADQEVAVSSRMQDGRSSALARQSGYASADSLLQAKNPGCDATAVEIPETWQECIASLAELGLIDEANDQLEQLKEAFPDFVVR
jgi:hypothetical protein